MDAATTRHRVIEVTTELHACKAASAPTEFWGSGLHLNRISNTPGFGLCSNGSLPGDLRRHSETQLMEAAFKATFGSWHCATHPEPCCLMEKSVAFQTCNKAWQRSLSLKKHPALSQKPEIRQKMSTATQPQTLNPCC